MGGVPQTVETLALAALTTCWLVCSCADGEGGKAVGRSAPTNVASRGLGGEGGGAPTADAPVGEGGDGGDGGDPNRLPLDAAGGQSGPGFLPVEGEAGAPPSCGNQSGAVCGANMVPASDPAMRYFCSRGDLIAQARCPGVCLTKSNACGMGSGTGGGMDETPLGVWLHCRDCLSVDCKAPLVACDADPWCAAHMDCKESCTVDEPCLSTCRTTFADDPLMDELNRCALGTTCLAGCAQN